MEPTQKKKSIWNLVMKLLPALTMLIVFLVMFFAPLFPAITHKKITNFIAEVNEKPYLVSSESYEDYNDLGYTQGTTTVYRLINSNSVQAAFDVFKQEEENAKKGFLSRKYLARRRKLFRLGRNKPLPLTEHRLLAESRNCIKKTYFLYAESNAYRVLSRI